MKMSDLLGEDSVGGAGETTAAVRGKEVTLRLTSALTQARIEEIIARPRPPCIQNPNKGSLAPLIPDTSDAGWQDAMDQRARRLQVIEIAVAMDLEVGNETLVPHRWGLCLTAQERKTWGEAAEVALGERLTRGEVVFLVNQMAHALIKLLPEEALGN